MAYISNEEVKTIRNNIKKEFSLKDGYKFSITRQHSSTINIAVINAPFNFKTDNRTVNYHHINSNFDDKEQAKFLNRITEIAMINNYDNSDSMRDYFDVGFYFTLRIGKFDQPFIFTELKEKVIKQVNNEEEAAYTVEKKTEIETKTDDQVIQQAIDIIEKRIKQPNNFISSPNDTKKILFLQLAEKEREYFNVLFLNNQHGIIANETLFKGTVNSASVYPREVVKKALKHNASAVIFSHNHPSGQSEESNADIQITSRLKKALDLVEVRVLDHLIIGNSESDITSFAEKGLL